MIDLIVTNTTLVFLAFIMIHVGIEFSIDRTRLRSYGWDYFVAFTAASLPWIFCALYFVYMFHHRLWVSQFDIWTDALLLARFASPTSAGVLFSMMAAAGLENTWVFKKARILAIFDDLDTIILLIPIKMMVLGFKWESLALLVVIGGLIYLAWKKMHAVRLPINWQWILVYSVLLAVACEAVYHVTDYLEDVSPVHIEILLPAFVLGCILAFPKKINIHDFFEHPPEKTIKFLVGAVFIFLVGVSMPDIGISQMTAENFWDNKIGNLRLSTICWHVLAITVLSNIGKMFPIFCYRKEASFKERFALALGLCPRGEVGAGVIIVALGLTTHIDKSLIVVAMLSLALNLILTGPIIMIIKKMLAGPLKERPIT